MEDESINNIQLKNIYIGDVDGEKEAMNKDILSLYYRVNNTVEEILSPDYYIITGKKGCGKTYLAHYIKKLKQESKNEYCEVFNTIKKFKLIRNIEENYTNNISEDCLDLFWEWLLYKELAYILINFPRNSSFSFKSFKIHNNKKKLRKFIKQIDDWDHDICKTLELIVNDLTSTTSNSEVGMLLAAVNDKISCSSKKELSTTKTQTRNTFYNILDELKLLVAKCLNENNKITLIFDELDEISDIILLNNTYYSNLINSLISTAKELNNKFRTQNVKIILVIRSDILDKIHSNSSNSNKISDSCVNLQWNSREKDYNHPLMDLVLTKIQYSTNYFKNMDKQTIYNMLFSEKVNGKSQVQYLISMGQGKPRDIIKYLNIIKSRYKYSPRFKEKYYRNVKSEYSKWYKDEIRNELALYLEGATIDQGFDLLTNFGKRTFYYEQLENYYNENKSSYSQIPNLHLLVKILFEFSVLGNYNPNEKKHLRYTWKYKEGGSPNFKNKFVIHIGLRSALRIK